MGLFSKDIKTMDNLFVHQLQDIYYAEKQILKALPEMIGKATDPKLKARFAELGAVPFVATPPEMVAFVAAETEKWGKAVKFSGATVD